MAIVDVSTLTVKMGKFPEAMAWFKKIREYHESQGIATRVLNPINGIQAEIVFEMEYDSLDAMQKYIGKFYQSDAWAQDFGKASWAEWFVDAGNVRHQYNVVK